MHTHTQSLKCGCNTNKMFQMLTEQKPRKIKKIGQPMTNCHEALLIISKQMT